MRKNVIRAAVAAGAVVGAVGSHEVFGGAVDAPATLPATAAAAAWTAAAWVDASNVSLGAGNYPSGTHAAATFEAGSAGRTMTVGSGVQITLPSFTFNNNASTGQARLGGNSDPGLLIWSTDATSPMTSPATVTVNGTGTGQARMSTPSNFLSNIEVTVNQTSSTELHGAMYWAAPISATGGGGLTKKGPGILSLNDNPKLYTGPTILDTNAGRTRIDIGGTPVNTSSFTIRSGSQLDLVANGSYTLGTGTLFLNGTGLGVGSFPGNFPGAIRNDTNIAAVITNPVVLQSNTVIHVQGASTGSTTFSGPISEVAGSPASLSLTVLGTAAAPGSDNNLGKYVLSNLNNSYSGGTIMNGGTLDVTAGSLGASTGPLTVNVVNFNNAQSTVNLNTSVDTTVGSLSGTRFGNTTTSSTINNGGRLFTVNQTTAGSYDGVITGAGGFTLGSLSTNTLTFINANSYTGKTNVNAGRLQATKANSLPGYATAGQVLVHNGGTLGVNAGAATGQWADTEIRDLYNAATFDAGSKLAIDTSGGDFNYGQGFAATNPNGLTKLGANTLTLSAAGNYTGGTTVSAGKLVVANADALGGGSLNVADATVAQVQASLPKAVTLASVSTNASGIVDLTDNSMVIRGSSLAVVQAQIASGFANGAWTGVGVDSSTAAADPTHRTAIGYADNSVLNKSRFKGVSGLSGGDVLVKYTYYGDADLNGVVTLDDFTQFLSGYQGNGKTWLVGDFDYNGKVTLDDFTLFLDAYQNQGAPLAALDEAVQSANISAGDRAMMLAAIQAVPEPTAVATLGLLAMAGGLMRRRRRSV